MDTVFFIAEFMPPELQDRFDFVGFDPRGVARSREVTCWTGEEYNAAFSATRLLPNPPSLSNALLRARSFVDACVQRSGDLLPYIGRALTLDGAYNPITYSRLPYIYDAGQYIALERSLTHFLAWCSDNPDACGFGDGDAEGAFDRLVAELDANPVVVSTPEGPGTVNAATLLMHVAFFMNNGMAGWPSLGAVLAEEQQTHGAGPFPPINDTGTANFFASNTAVECADRAFPRSLSVLRRRLAVEARLGKRVGPLFAYGPPSYDHAHATACVQWPAFASDNAPSRYRGGWRAQRAPGILVVGTTGDPDTPYPDAVALSRILSSGMLISLRGEGHTAFLRSECITGEVVNYLVALQRPRVKWCDDEPPPDTPIAGAQPLRAAAPIKPSLPTPDGSGYGPRSR